MPVAPPVTTTLMLFGAFAVTVMAIWLTLRITT